MLQLCPEKLIYFKKIYKIQVVFFIESDIIFLTSFIMRNFANMIYGLVFLRNKREFSVKIKELSGLKVRVES